MNVFIFLILTPLSYHVSGQDLKSELEESVKLVNLSDVCTCSEIGSDQKSFELKIFCTGQDKLDSLADLDKIQWPPNPNKLKISAVFDGLRPSSLGKLPPNGYVESLRFSNNGMNTYWPDPFSGVPNLKTLYFTQNDLKVITPDLFTNIDQLEELDLSYNKLSDINPLIFKRLQNVVWLSLRGNDLTSVPLEALLPMVNLEELDLSSNRIHDVLLQRPDGVGLDKLKRINLRNNRIRLVTEELCPPENIIEHIDASYNTIELVDQDTFEKCPHLNELNLDHNNITFIFGLPPSLQIAIFKVNLFYQWPVFPESIQYIDMSYNSLIKLYDDEITSYQSLEVLKLAGNGLSEFNMNRSLPKLYTLDLSHNHFTEIPESLRNEYLPKLAELRVDGNPIKSISFPNTLVLQRLYMNDLDHLTTVDDKAFSNVVGGRYTKSDMLKCFSLFLSNCDSLSEIREGAFSGTNLCYVDLSKNNLTYLSRDVLPWANITDGVDLQNNPWHCGCELQWMVDQLVPHLYATNSSKMLDNLRCGSPTAYKDARLVHWYNWTEQVMCGASFMRAGPYDTYILESSENPSFNVSSLTLILGACIIVSLLVALALAVYLIKTRRQYRIRQAALQRKRQSAYDATNKNGVDKEQFVSLNRC